MRRSEILHLRWSDIDFERSRITLKETKNSEIRSVSIAGIAKELLLQLFHQRRVESFLVFPSKNPFKPIDIRFSWEAAVDQAGLQDFKFHDLRHSCASYLCMSGISLGGIAEILGHKSLSMTKRYSHVSDSHALKAVSKMNETIFAGKKVKEMEQ